MSENTLLPKLIAWLRAEPRRLTKAFGYAVDGLKEAFNTQPAFRLEVLLSVPLFWWVLHIRANPGKKAILIGVVMLVLVAELLNTAIEAAIDRISTETHPLSKKAKDMGAAAVLLALVNAAIVWWFLL